MMNIDLEELKRGVRLQLDQTQQEARRTLSRLEQLKQEAAALRLKLKLFDAVKAFALEEDLEQGNGSGEGILPSADNNRSDQHTTSASLPSGEIIRRLRERERAVFPLLKEEPVRQRQPRSEKGTALTLRSSAWKGQGQ
ncbi:MAG: hypothetical protein ACE5JX_06720 [Acidobacteriota bacterium]